MFKHIILDNLHLSDVNPRTCGMETCRPGHYYGPAIREYYLLHYVIRGGGTFSSGGHTYTLRSGQIFVIRPGELTYYEADVADPWEYIWVGFDCSPVFEPLFRHDVLSLPAAGHTFRKISSCEQEPMKTLYICSQLYTLFSQVALSQGNPPAHAERYVSQALNYIESNYSQTMRVQSIADGLGLNRNYFCRIFKAHTGFSPQEYIVSFRLSKAAQFMTERGMSPGEAARQVGYPDVYAFSRMFSRKYGLAPGRYAARLRNAASPGPEKG